jgi:uncharacterized protein
MQITRRGARVLARGLFTLALMLGVIGVLLVPRAAMAFTPPPPDGAVTDTSGRLTAEDDRIIEAEIAAYRARTGHEIAVLMVGSLGGESVDDVAYTTANKWGVGKKGSDDGVLLVIAPNERKMRIETGKGVGDRLTDLESSHILRDDVGPLLKANRFREAILAGVRRIEAALGTDATTAPRAASKPAASSGGGVLTFVLVVMGLVFIGFCVGFILLVRRLVNGAGGARRTYDGGSSGASYGTTSTDSWSGSSGSSDFGGGSSGGSDFGGSSGGSDFGGGSSGGGGSSDSY